MFIEQCSWNSESSKSAGTVRHVLAGTVQACYSQLEVTEGDDIKAQPPHSAIYTVMCMLGTRIVLVRCTILSPPQDRGTRASEERRRAWTPTTVP